MDELTTKLELSLKEFLNLNVKIYISKGEIIIYGLKSKIQEIETLIFIHGFLACWKTKNEKTNLVIFNPEVG